MVPWWQLVCGSYSSIRVCFCWSWDVSPAMLRVCLHWRATLDGRQTGLLPKRSAILLVWAERINSRGPSLSPPPSQRISCIYAWPQLIVLGQAWRVTLNKHTALVRSSGCVWLIIGQMQGDCLCAFSGPCAGDRMRPARTEVLTGPSQSAAGQTWPSKYVMYTCTVCCFLFKRATVNHANNLCFGPCHTSTWHRWHTNNVFLRFHQPCSMNRRVEKITSSQSSDHRLKEYFNLTWQFALHSVSFVPSFIVETRYWIHVVLSQSPELWLSCDQWGEWSHGDITTTRFTSDVIEDWTIHMTHSHSY